jgi:Lipid A core - O-antigen ligase and related enzymes
MAYQTVSQKANHLAQWAAIALGFSIPISVALDNVLLLLILLLWLLGASYRSKLETIRSNPVALLALALFGMYLLGIPYTDASRKDVMDSLSKAAQFLFIPLLIPLLHDPRARHKALWGFLAAMLLTLVLSYLMGFELLPQSSAFKGYPGNPVLFKKHITQNLLMAFSAFIFAVYARNTLSSSMRGFFTVLSALAAFNVLFMVNGRTGHLVLLVLMAYFFLSGFRWKGLLIACAALMLVAGVAYLAPISALHQRAALAFQQFSEWHPGQAATQESSIGQRMEFWTNSLEIVRHNPIIGVGTGGFIKAYADQVDGSAMAATRNPHNEYLMLTVQFGLPGLALLLYLFFAQWRLAAALPSALEQAIARGLVLAIACASMVSSTLIDHTEGLFYVWMSALLFAALSAPANHGKDPAR